jgi:hypothetical protein
VTDGNSDTLLFTANVLALRKWDTGEFSAGGSMPVMARRWRPERGLRPKGSVSTTTSSPSAGTAFGRAEGLHDSIADIKPTACRSPPVPATTLIKNDKVTLSAEVGPGYVFEKVGGRFPGIRHGSVR